MSREGVWSQVQMPMCAGCFLTIQAFVSFLHHSIIWFKALIIMISNHLVKYMRENMKTFQFLNFITPELTCKVLIPSGFQFIFISKKNKKHGVHRTVTEKTILSLKVTQFSCGIIKGGGPIKKAPCNYRGIIKGGDQ